jgi:hypothetical protein
VFVVVTLLVALGIAVAQGCQGPARGLGGEDGVQRQRHAQPGSLPLDGSEPASGGHMPATLGPDFGK